MLAVCLYRKSSISSKLSLFVDIKLFQSSFTIGRSDIPFLFLILVTCVFLLDQSS